MRVRGGGLRVVHSEHKVARPDAAGGVGRAARLDGLDPAAAEAEAWVVDECESWKGESGIPSDCTIGLQAPFNIQPAWVPGRVRHTAACGAVTGLRNA